MVPQEASYPQRLQEINEQYGFIESAGEEFTPIIVREENVEIPTFESFEVTETDISGESASGMYLEDYAEFKPDEHFQYEKIYQNGSSNGFAYDYNGENAIPLVVTDFDVPENGFQTGSFDGAVEHISDDSIMQTEPQTKIIDEAKLQEELETVEYYFAQGYKDLAIKTLDSLVENFGNLPEIEAARRLLEDETQPESTTIDTSPESTTIEASNAAGTSKNFDILNDFRSELGLEEPDSADEQGDYETHYQLGVAYQEMGLMEDAIREYQEAIKIVSTTDGTRRFFHCCNLLGHCFMEKGMPNIALMWYRRGIDTVGLSPEELQGLRYEIANAYEAGGEPDKAVEYFEQIYAVNVEYRDVSERLSQLQAAR
jgi:tetratricopeptide (TPR) repeat protein